MDREVSIKAGLLEDLLKKHEGMVRMRRWMESIQYEKRKALRDTALNGMKQDELYKLYQEWDYRYKPSFQLFNHVLQELMARGYDLPGYLEDARCRAYYSGSWPSADHGFMEVACLIYLAMAKGIPTPYDHVLNSGRSFEWKMNNLHEERNPQSHCVNINSK